MTTPLSEPPPSDPAPDGPAVGGRLHPAVIGLWALNGIGPLAFFALTGSLAVGLAVVIIGASALVGLARYLRFSWRVEGATFVIEQGLLQRQRRVIPMDRIQSVEAVRRLRHRAFGVVELRIETVGGGSSEGRLDALSPADAQSLRALLLGGGSVAAADAETVADVPTLVRLRPTDLVVAGLTGGRVGVAAALLGVGQDVFGSRIERYLPSVDLLADVAATAAVAAAVLAGAFLLSVVATVVTYWDFTVTLDGDDLRVRRGLLEQRSETLPLRRVQALRIEQNLLRRPFGLAAVKVDVAGRSGGDEARMSAFLLPIGSMAQAQRLVSVVADRPGVTTVALAPMPRGARDRRLVRAVVVTAALTVAGVVWRGAIGVAGLAVIVPAAAVAMAAYRSLGWATVGDLVVARAGWLVRRTSFVPRHRLQSLALTQSPFQRRRRLASLELQIARSGTGLRPHALIDMDTGEAVALLRTLTRADASAGGGAAVDDEGLTHHRGGLV